ncbi:MAG: acyl carrier protein [Synechococcales cyanobacterium RU_4_20]|nr:acyl carrier protein [Synechococcales cyanobacterium RU_4_20]NJR67765.1 acyl carrier protein [Synechococcales cyanobacterium CRU_2_2]
MITSTSTLTAEAIQEWMVAQLAAQTDYEPDEIDPTVTFDNFGLDSAKAMALMAEAEKFLGFEVSPTLLWHYPTLETFSARLAEEAADIESQLLAQVDDATLAKMLAEVEAGDEP